jgi:hypothetical protein
MPHRGVKIKLVPLYLTEFWMCHKVPGDFLVYFFESMANMYPSDLNLKNQRDKQHNASHQNSNETISAHFSSLHAQNMIPDSDPDNQSIVADEDEVDIEKS